MQQAKIEQAYFNEYLGFIETGATEAEAVMQVATSNEVSCCNVIDALQRAGLHNPCGHSQMYCF
jgi:hypothetical protein